MNDLSTFDELENRLRLFAEEFRRLKSLSASSSAPDPEWKSRLATVEEKVRHILKLVDELEKELHHE
ncbi:MAG: hypothetical protein D6762_04035 [Candidatus Neomarinimicrobiota bacterium]|nr:MAG: hypothetical protein D6762_04035 [Candidatus Neomarinimicrobiota bacterium]